LNIRNLNNDKMTKQLDKITIKVQRFGNVIITQYIQDKKIIQTVTEYK
jgi:hypothetical protein